MIHLPIKNCLPFLATIIIIVGCNSAKNIIHERLDDSSNYTIAFMKAKKNKPQFLLLAYGKIKSKDFWGIKHDARFQYIMDGISCDKLLKTNYTDNKNPIYYILTDSSVFNTPFSKTDILLLNKLKPAVDSLHFCQRNLIQNATGFEIITKEKVREIYKF